MNFFFFWIGSAVATIVIAGQKRLSMVLFALLGFFLGPLGLLIVALIPSRKTDSNAQKSVFSFNDAKNELEGIKNSVVVLQNRIASLEKNIGVLSSATQEVPSTSEEPVVDANKAAAVVEQEALPARQKESFEFVFGKYWLNRIGVVVFFLGVAFFISYTFRYLNAIAKICIGYLIAAGFFAWGNFLEKKERYQRIAWGILGCSWGLFYLTTYAMYYIRATRIVNSPLAELVFLATVSSVAVIYNLRYRSWIVTAITYLLAFITAGLGGIEYSTIVYCAFLIASIVYLAYSFTWHELLVFGIVGVNVTYGYWLVPQIFSSSYIAKALSVPVIQFHLSFGIVCVSWALFTAGLLLMKNDDQKWLRYIIHGTLLNAGFYVFFGLSELYRVRPHLGLGWDVRFWFLLALAALYFLFAFLCKVTKRENVIVSNAAIAFTLIAMAAVVRFPRLSVAFFWILEMAIIFSLGIYYKEFVYRIIAAVLGIIIVFRLLIVDFTSYRYYELFGVLMKHSISIFIFAALCFFIMGAMVNMASIRCRLKIGEAGVYRSFAAFATLLVVMICAKEVAAKWCSLWWIAEGIAVFALGVFLRDRVYRICGLSVLALSCLRLFIFDMFTKNNTPVFVAAGLCFFVIGAAINARSIRALVPAGEVRLARCLIVVATGLFVFLCAREIPAKWLSLWWAIEGISVLGVGFLLRDKLYRVCGLIVLSLSSVRLIFVDMAGFETMYRIITFLALGVILLGASLVYSKVIVRTKE